MALIFFLASLFLPAVLIHSQQHSQSVQINWYERPVKKTIYDPVKKQTYTIEHLSFEGAVLDENIPLLPKYHQYLENGAYHVEITNTYFKPLETKMLQYIEEPGKLPAHIEVRTTVKYVRKRPGTHVEVLPLRKNRETGKIEKLTGFTLKHSTLKSMSLKAAPNAVQRYAQNSVLVEGNWYKMKVSSDGIYKLTYDDITTMGFNNPQNVSIYGYVGGMLPFIHDGNQPDDLEEIPVKKVFGTDNQFNKGDYLLFYAKGPVKWQYDTLKAMFVHTSHLYSYYSYYFVSDRKAAREIKEIPSLETIPTHKVTSFDDYLFHELDTINLINSGRQWYGENFSTRTDYAFEFDFPDIETQSPLKLMIELAARSATSSHFNIRVNNKFITRKEVDDVDISRYISTYADTAKVFETINPEGETYNIEINYERSTSSSEGWLNFILLNARRKLRFNGEYMHFRDVESVGKGNIAEYTIQNTGSQTEVWDISDIHNIKKISGISSGNTFSFTLPSGELKEYVVLNPSYNFKKPVLEGEDVGEIDNQNLHGLPIPDYLIVTHGKFLAQANELAEFHRNNSDLDIVVIDQELIFNEFSSGARDVSAIRNFMKMFYDRAQTPEEAPRYLLLFGDGTYDNKNLNENNNNYILTYQSKNSLTPTKSFVADDFYGLLDDNENLINGGIDVGIGRFPVKNEEEAMVFINKIKTYYTEEAMGSWRNRLCFIGDDEDGNLHMRQANSLAGYVNENYPQFITDKIYLDAYKQESTSSGARYPMVNKTITDNIRKGSLIINYTGHGGEYGLAHERVINVDDILSWDNNIRFPVFMTATCEFSRFDDVKITSTGEFEEFISAGEYVVLNPNGGAVASYTTTRLVYADSNYDLNYHFYEFVFQTDSVSGKKHRLGDVMRLTKNNTSQGINKRNFSLLGDPALKLAYPLLNVVTDSINGQTVEEVKDTVGALSKVNISGYITNNHGQVMENFNGTVYPSVYDKPSTITTLANDDNEPFVFEAQNNILYKGKATVENGRFNFSFIVPKDISYNIGNGSIHYYAQSNGLDANGSNQNILIGGFSDQVIVDNNGPEIRLFMNDSHFVDGGITNKNPVILAYVEDESGINTVGSGIGHDITAIIDNDVSQLLVLNDFYEADKDSYRSGKISYPLSDLEEGSHRLSMKVWDVLNNSSVKEIEFVVIESENFTLEKILNYPNPFQEYTTFAFEHNYPSGLMDVTIRIYTISGKLVKTIRTSFMASGYRSPGIEWNGMGEYGDQLSSGVYFYRISVKSEFGNVEKYDKLVIMK